MIVVVISGIIAAIAIPNIVKARDRVRKDSCVSTLRQIKLAKEQWALDNDKESTDIPEATDLDSFVRGTTADLVCPSDPLQTFASSYTINAIMTDPACLVDPEDHHL